MATLDPTIGGPGANTYLTIQDADQLADARPGADDWADASTAVKTRALIQAAYRLNDIEWTGRRATEAQALAWPRVGVRDRDGYAVPPDAVPDVVKRAQFELALTMLDGVPLADTGLEGFESVQVGPIGVTPRHTQRAGALPEIVARAIRPLVAGGGTATIRLVRA